MIFLLGILKSGFLQVFSVFEFISDISLLKSLTKREIIKLFKDKVLVDIKNIEKIRRLIKTITPLSLIQLVDLIKSMIQDESKK